MLGNRSFVMCCCGFGDLCGHLVHGDRGCHRWYTASGRGEEWHGSVSEQTWLRSRRTWARDRRDRVYFVGGKRFTPAISNLTTAATSSMSPATRHASVTSDCSTALALDQGRPQYFAATFTVALTRSDSSSGLTSLTTVATSYTEPATAFAVHRVTPGCWQPNSPDGSVPNYATSTKVKRPNG